MFDRLNVGGERRVVVCGDFNAHNAAWDTRVRGDTRGDEVLSWADDRELVVMNDGEVTRVARGVGTQSTPDVSLCSADVEDELEWCVRRELGSDHFPILIKSRSRTEKEECEKELVWNWKGARWEEYREEVRSAVAKVEWADLSVREFEKRLRAIVLRAADKFVGKKRRKVVGELVSSRVRDALRERDALKGADDIDWVTVREIENRIAGMVKEEKEGQWRCLLDKGATVGEMWSVVNGLSRRSGPRQRKGEVMVDEGRVMVTAREKANGFVRVYEKVSRVRVPKDRRMKSKVNRLLRGFGPEGEDGGDVSLDEVKRALSEMNGGKAGGPDGLHPTLLVNSLICRKGDFVDITAVFTFRK